MPPSGDAGSSSHHKGLRVLDKFLTSTGHFEQSVVLYLFLQIAGNECLTDDGIPNLRVFIFARAKLIEVLMLMGHNLVGVATCDEVDDIVAAEVLLDGHNGLKCDDQLVACVNLGAWTQTVVTVAAVVLVVLLAKIVQQHLAATDTGLGVCSRFLQQLSADILLGHRFALHKLIQFLQVLIAVESQADALTAIAASASCFLIVAFERLGDIIVDNEAHIGFVDTHTESDGSHDDVDTLHKEVILRLRARAAIQSGMIGSRLDIVGTQHVGQIFYLLARETVDDTALAGMLLDESHNILVNILRLGAHLIIEVRTVERALELGGIEDAQILLDIRTHLVGSCGRQSDDGRLSHLVNDRTYATLLRTEIMSPLRDTMGLVDGIERNLHRLQELHIIVLGERLGCHIQQLGPTLANVLLHLVDGRLVERGVKEMSRTLLLAQVGNEVHLIFHQGDEWRDDDSHTIHE